jgi:hypothetical protein
MKEKLIVFAIISVVSFSMHYFLFPRDNNIGQMLSLSVIPAVIFALMTNYIKMLGEYIFRKIFKPKAH